MRQIFAICFSIWATCLALATAAAADGPVVIELYTSQGCSSCPPADEMMLELAQRPGVIALALHVDYWDYIGWADSFAEPSHTTRQKRYARIAGARSIYTPQMIIGGKDHVVGSKPMDVMDLIQTHAARTTGAQISLSRSGDTLQISGQSQQAFSDGTVVQVIRYSPRETVEIHRGENAGHTITYANIVTDWDAVAEWDGRSALDLSVAISGNAPVVVIVQEPGPGAVIASAQLR